jgi:hypothetical protein
MLLKPPRTAPAPPRPSRIPPSYAVPDTALADPEYGGPLDDTAPIPAVPAVPLPVEALRAAPPPRRRARLALIPLALIPLRARLAGAAGAAAVVVTALLWVLLAASPTQHSPYGQAAPPGVAPGTTLPGPSASRGHLRPPAAPGQQQAPDQPQRPSLVDIQPTAPSGGRGPGPGQSTTPGPPGSTVPTPPPISQSPPPPSTSPSPTKSSKGCLGLLILRVCTGL